MKKKRLPASISYWQEFIPKLWLSLKSHYSLRHFRSDLIAGVTVGIVALPLAMAFAIASGLPPVTGLYTSIVAGFLTSLLGGSYFQVSGPTGAFVVVIYGIVQTQGYEGLAIATIMAGVILLIAALFKLGTLIKFIPYPLITGFTTGIAFIIFLSQIKDFLGLQIRELPAEFFPKCLALFSALPTWNPLTTLIASSTLFLILLIRRLIPFLPWGITSIVIITAICSGFGLEVETIYSRFGEIPSKLPLPSFPRVEIIFENWYLLIQSAITIAFLAGIESLLSAVVADGMTGRSHHSNSELLAQGIGNIGSICFGGIPATGAIARTAMNIKSGAKSPVSGIIHALTLLFIMFALAPLVSQVPLSALSAVLVMVAWNMSEIKHFRHLFKAPVGDVAVLLTTFFLTVVINLVVAIEVGMILAAFLFMKRVRDLSGVHALQVISEEAKEGEKPDPDAIEKKHIPQGVEVYEITGLFFLELADSLKSVMSNLALPPKVFILRLRKIPIIDASGMHALNEFYIKCSKQKTVLILSGVNDSVFKSLKKFGLVDLIGKDLIFPHIDPSLKKAVELMGNGMLK